MLLPGRIATMAVRSARAATGSDRRGRKAREGLDARRTIDLTDRCRSAGGYVTYQQLMGLANGYADSKVLLVANELGVFTAIGTGGHRVNALAAACETTHEGMRLLLHASAGLGLLRRKADRYWNTPLGLRFLDGHSPQAITNLLWLLNHHWSDWTGMTRAIRRAAPDGRRSRDRGIPAPVRPRDAGTQPCLGSAHNRLVSAPATGHPISRSRRRGRLLLHRAGSGSTRPCRD
jgi:hypothetical protein